MAQWIKATATKPDDPGSISKTYKVERTDSHSCPLISTCVPLLYVIYTYINEHTHMIKVQTDFKKISDWVYYGDTLIWLNQ